MVVAGQRTNPLLTVLTTVVQTGSNSAPDVFLRESLLARRLFWHFRQMAQDGCGKKCARPNRSTQSGIVRGLINVNAVNKVKRRVIVFSWWTIYGSDIMNRDDQVT